MRGHKRFKPKLFTNFNLVDAVPDDNFYKILSDKLDLGFIIPLTHECYSHTGRPSLDPVVFFKILLIGYLENKCSDRSVERMIQNRLDLRLFIGYDIDETVPDHSTICKARKRIPVSVFEEVFGHILQLCMDAGLVGGHTQSIDSAYINANASLDRMEEIKLAQRDPQEYLEEVKLQDLPHDVSQEDIVARAKKNEKDLTRFKEQRRKKYTDSEGGKEHKKNKRRFFSHATHRSSTDPDARVAKKSGKPRMLCYTSTASVDTQANVITNITAEYASQKDSQILIRHTNKTLSNLEDRGLSCNTILADAGFSSGENYKYLEEKKIEGFIPLHGTYQTHRDGFKYDGRRRAFICPQGQVLKAKYTKSDHGRKQMAYTSSKKICDKCPLREECVNTKGIKVIMSTLYKAEYERMLKKLKSKIGRSSYALRMQTVEPVFGSLQQYYGLRWMNTRGIKNANKVMLMSAAAFNLKKWIKSSYKDLKKGVYRTMTSLIFYVRCCVENSMFILMEMRIHKPPVKTVF
ncbi:MAG: IS1182 family transposase [Bacteroidota bacterium]